MTYASTTDATGTRQEGALPLASSSRARETKLAVVGGGILRRAQTATPPLRD
jgi:hypothetical protein